MWLEYLIFILKTLTIVFAIALALALITGIFAKNKKSEKEQINLKKLNQKYRELAKNISQEILDKKSLKQWLKTEKTQLKELEKNKNRQRLFVVDFQGDVRANQVKGLREIITAIILVAKKDDAVLLKLESPGGMVTGYGLAASQLQRLRDHKIDLTVAVDKVAASGGYLMACVANKIIAAPFAVLGSIGVIAQLPNFHRWLKEKNIDFEQITAGKYKRTLTVFGENTEEGREKLQEEIDDTHILFKEFVSEHRPQINLEQVATGEHWYGERAYQLKLIDKIQTSDDYILSKIQSHDVYLISHQEKLGFKEKFFRNIQALLYH